MAIGSFKCSDTHAVFAGGRPPARFKPFLTVLERKLDMLDAAHVLQDLASPRGNHLEVLKKDRKGQHAIRVNGQYRLCFIWRAHGPHDVECVDTLRSP